MGYSRKNQTGMEGVKKKYILNPHNTPNNLDLLRTSSTIIGIIDK